MRKFLFTASAVYTASASKSPTSAISKVITILQDMKSQVTAETKAGADENEATQNQCIADISGLEGDVTYTQEKLDTATATQEKAAAESAKYQAEAEELAPVIAQAESEIAAGKQAQKEAQQQFSAEEAELTEAVQMLTSAYSVLKRSLAGPGESFLQMKSTKASPVEIEKVVTALKSIVNAGWVDKDSKGKVQSFIEEDDSLSLSKALSLAQNKAPQAQTSNYQSKSGGILDAIQKMQNQAETELTDLKNRAMKSRHAHEMLMQDLTSTVSSKTEQLDAAKAHAAEAAGNAKDAGADAENQKSALKDFKKTLRDTKAGCERAAKDWAARSAEAQEEISVIQQAVDILSGKFGGDSLLQVSKKGYATGKSVKISSIIRQLTENNDSEKIISFGLLQASELLRTSDDPFEKVRKLIVDMISKLEQEQADEAKKEAMCVENKKKGAMKVKVTKGQLEQTQARSDKANATASKLAVEIDEMSTEVKNLEGARANWTSERNAEAQEYEVVVKDTTESIEALSAAIEKLNEFYGSSDSTAFLQSSKLSDKGSTIISILETAQSDFEKLLHTTKSNEAEAIRTFEQRSQDAEVTLAKTKAMIEGKQSQLAASKQLIETLSGDLDNAQKAYEAASEFLAGVMETCAVKPMSFEEKQAKRLADIDGLKQALEILSGDAE